MLTELEGRTAVVTGAASGIGLGLARRCRQRGMNVALLDVEEAGARGGRAARRRPTTDVLACTVDVSDPDAMHAAADRGLLPLRRRPPALQQRRRVRRWPHLDHDGRRLPLDGRREPRRGAERHAGPSCPGCSSVASRATSSTRRRSPGWSRRPMRRSTPPPRPPSSPCRRSCSTICSDAGSSIGVSVLCPGLVRHQDHPGRPEPPAGPARHHRDSDPRRGARLLRHRRPTRWTVADRVLDAVEQRRLLRAHQRGEPAEHRGPHGRPGEPQRSRAPGPRRHPGGLSLHRHALHPRNS